MGDSPLSQNNDLGSLLRGLPSVDEMMRKLSSQASRAMTLNEVRLGLEQVRTEIKAGRHNEASLATRIQALSDDISANRQTPADYSLRPVINATGVILHTNLGRAPLSRRALAHIAETAGGYCNLEFDLESGKRGRRERIPERLLLMLLATYSRSSIADLNRDYGVFVANNCAAATFLTLNSLAAGGEVIVSRGELVEIGGGFRIPEILAKAGATLREVGTTNKTRLSDYRTAMSSQTKLILRVSRSNFRISGFTERPDLPRLIELAKQHRVPVFDDQGTGSLLPLRTSGVDEPTFAESIMSKVDVAAASGDKLLGGPQAGLIVGRRELIESISRNPLARALRVDKLTYAALEATLLDYANEQTSEIPVIRMIEMPAAEIRARAEALTAQVSCELLKLSVERGHSVIGGGTTPGTKLTTYLLVITHELCRAADLIRKLRKSSPSVVARIVRDQVMLDLRTVPPELDVALVGVLNSLAERDHD